MSGIASFQIQHSTFSKLYFLYPFIFWFLTRDVPLPMEMLIVGILAATLIAGLISQWLFGKYIKPATTITITDDALVTYGFNGDENPIPWQDLVGPIETNMLLLNRYVFRSTMDNSQIIMSSLTEDHGRLLAMIKERQDAAQA